MLYSFNNLTLFLSFLLYILPVFSLTPTSSDQFMDQSSNVPTVSVIHHTTPKVAPLSGAQPSVMVGNDPSWILVPTRTGILGGLLSSDEREDGGPTTLKWGFGPGVPTPDPALLNQHLNADPDKGSPTTLKWNLGIGVPTPDPALLLNADPDAGSPTNLKWNYPPGVPTPDPALLIEISPPHGGPDDGSPTTLKWAFPPGIPTPDPALLVVRQVYLYLNLQLSLFHYFLISYSCLICLYIHRVCLMN